MALFPLPVKAEMSDRFRMPARVLQFGDGYEQTGLAGLSRQQTTWDIEVIISSAAQDALFNSFLLEHGQHKSFTWQSPRDTSPQLYRITGDVSSTRRNGGGSKPVFFSRRMQFKKSWEQPPVVAAPKPSISVVGNAPTGWNILSNISTSITVNYSILVTPTSGSPYTVTGSKLLAGNSVSVPQVPIGGNFWRVTTSENRVFYVGDDINPPTIISSSGNFVSCTANGFDFAIGYPPPLVGFGNGYYSAWCLENTESVSEIIPYGLPGTEILTITASAQYNIGSPSSASISF